MAKYFFIGGINKGGTPRGGAEAKNQFLLKKLQSTYVDELDYVDMTSSTQSLIFRYLKLIKGILKHEHIILSVASTALEKLAYLNFYLKKKKVTIFIIGGVVDQKLANPRMLQLFENANLVYAETKALTKSIKSISEKIPVKHLPNFKKLIEFTDRKKSNKDEIIKFVFLSRVHRDKGIFRAIETVKMLNKTSNNRRFILDIYGLLDLTNEDKTQFDKLTKSNDINYKGFLDLSLPDSLTTLSGYHFFIFLTNHPGEGFPGVLIDALHAGAIIIASDWKYNNEIVPQNSLIVNIVLKNYLNTIKKYINGVLNMEEETYHLEVKKLKEESVNYDINHINFKIA